MTAILTINDLAEEAPIEREVQIAGKSFKAFFRKVSSGQHEQLMEVMLKGQRVQASKESKRVELEVDICSIERKKLMMVQFSVVTSDGKPFFKSLADVQQISRENVEALAIIAEEVNGAEEDPGKS